MHLEQFQLQLCAYNIANLSLGMMTAVSDEVTVTRVTVLKLTALAGLGALNTVSHTHNTF